MERSPFVKSYLHQSVLRVFMCATYSRSITVSCHWHADSIICATNFWIQCDRKLNVTTDYASILERAPVISSPVLVILFFSISSVSGRKTQTKLQLKAFWHLQVWGKNKN